MEGWRFEKGSGKIKFVELIFPYLTKEKMLVGVRLRERLSQDGKSYEKNQESDPKTEDLPDAESACLLHGP